ncbi:hypothetical protein [Salinispira pacifica]
MVDYLLHFYRKGDRPFRSLSALTDEQAIAAMTALYVPGSVFWERFRDPGAYFTFRRGVECELHAEFVRKGGRPKRSYPIYFVLGRPRWTVEAVDEPTLATTSEIQIPLSAIDASQISFTYPDSMTAALIRAEKNPEYYDPECHGRLFTLHELASLVSERGVPGEDWGPSLPPHLPNYVEAQVWDEEPLLAFLP